MSEETIKKDDVVKDETPPAKEDKKKKKTVEVEESLLKQLLTEVADLKERATQFEQTASQDQIRKIEALRAQGKLVKSVKLRRFEGDLVLGWKIVEDRVWVADGKLNEIQTIEVYPDGGEPKQTTLLQFGRACLYEPYEVIREARLGSGDTEFTVMLPDGRELVVNSKYVN